MSHLAAVTVICIAFGAVIGAAVGMPWAGAGAGLSIAVGFVIALGD